jgi:hypothetical protein
MKASALLLGAALINVCSVLNFQNLRTIGMQKKMLSKASNSVMLSFKQAGWGRAGWAGGELLAAQH